MVVTENTPTIDSYFHKIATDGYKAPTSAVTTPSLDTTNGEEDPITQLDPESASSAVESTSVQSSIATDGGKAPTSAVTAPSLDTTNGEEDPITQLDPESASSAIESTSSVDITNETLSLNTDSDGISFTHLDLTTMDINKSASATEPSNLVPMEVDQPLSSTDLNVVPVAAPAWLTALKMDIYFQECSDTTAWQLLVQSFYKFEVGNTVNGVCR